MKTIDEIIEQLKNFYCHGESGFDRRQCATYVELTCANSPQGAEKHSVKNSVKKFLDDGEARTLLIQGPAGSGKSLLTQNIAYELWQQDKKTYIPLWLWLPRLLSALQSNNLIDCLLKSYRLEDEDIEIFKQACQKGEIKLLLILDGWDEVPVLQTNLLQSNGLFGADWPHMKLLVTSRPEILSQYAGGYREFLSGVQSIGNLFQEKYLQPFDSDQIAEYIKRFITQCQGDSCYIEGSIPVFLRDDHTTCTSTCTATADAQQPLFWDDPSLYIKALSKLPGLRSLSQTPFVLTILIQVLPRILLEAEQNPSNNGEIGQLTLTHYQLYKFFIDQWLTEQVERLWKNNTSKDFFVCYLNPPKDYTPSQDLSEVLKRVLKACLQTYCKNLARAAFNRSSETLEVLLDETVTLNPYLVYSPNNEPYLRDGMNDEVAKKALEHIRSGSLLRSQLGPNDGSIYHNFLHKSLLEFFAADQLQHSICTTILADSDNVNKELSLNDQLLNKEPNVIRFLVDKVQQDERVAEQLEKIIELSRGYPFVAVASANALTVLNAAGKIFNKKDFSWTRFPGAILTGMVAQGANFSHADCRNVNFRHAWLRDANFSGACLENTDLGRLSHIQLDHIIFQHALSPDNHWLALSSYDGQISFYDLTIGQVAFKVQIKPENFIHRTVNSVASWGARTLLKYNELRGAGFIAHIMAFDAASQNLYVIIPMLTVFCIGIEKKKIIRRFSIANDEDQSTADKSDLELNDEDQSTADESDLELYAEKIVTVLNSIGKPAHNILLIDSPEEAIIYPHFQDKTYKRLSVNSQDQQNAFDGQVIMAIAPCRTLVLTYDGSHQTLYSIKDGVENRQLIYQYTSSYTPARFDNYFRRQLDKQDLSTDNNHIGFFTAAISPDRRYWMTLAKTTLGFVIEIVDTNKGSVFHYPEFTTESPGEISFTFSAIANEVIILLEPGNVICWNWQTATITAEYSYSEKLVLQPVVVADELILLPMIRGVERVLLDKKVTSFLLRFDLKKKTRDLCFSTKKPKALFTSIDYSRKLRDLTMTIIDENNVTVNLNQHHFTIPNINKEINKKNKSARPMVVASTDKYVAIPYGYWGVESHHMITVHQLYRDEQFVSRLAGGVAMLHDKLDKKRPVIQNARIYLRHLEQGCELYLRCKDPIIAMSFSDDNRYFAALDAAFKLQVWQLEPPSTECRKIKAKAINQFIRVPIYANFLDMECDPQLVVDNSGLVIISYKKTVLVVDHGNMKCISLVIGLDIDNIMLLDNNYLACQIATKNIIFKIADTTHGKDLILEHTDVSLPLQLKNTQFQQAFGLTYLQRHLLKEQNALGEPVDFLDKDTTEPLVSQFNLSHFYSSINDPCPIIEEAYYHSQLHPKAPLINYKNWVIALVRDDASTLNSKHTFLLIEGLNSLGQGFYIRIELFTKEAVVEVDNGQIKEYSIDVEQGFAKIRLSHSSSDNKSIFAKNLSEQALSEQLSQLLSHPKESLMGQAWIVKRKKLVALYQYVHSLVQRQASGDKSSLIPYNFLGRQAVLFGKGHNCYTWAKELLLRLKEPEITKALKKSLTDYIATNPGTQLNNSLLKEVQRPAATT